MRKEKGTYGYRTAQKRRMGLRTLLEFAVIMLLLLAGYLVTKTRLNWFTLIAILGCLPAAKALVAWIVLLPHKSIPAEMQRQIQDRSSRLLVLYDLVLTSEQKIMPLDSVTISGKTICGYAVPRRGDNRALEDYLKKILRDNHVDGWTVKVFADITAYIARIEGLQHIAETEDTMPLRIDHEIERQLKAMSM